MNEERVSAAGVDFHCRIAGDGPLLLLLHGFPQTSHAWRHQIPALAERFRVVAPDMLGYGQTSRPTRVRDYRIPQLAGNVAALVNALGAERAHVVGHDWGGIVAWATALEHPEVVDHLAVLNAPHPTRFARALVSSPRQVLRSWYILFFQVPWLPEWLLARGAGFFVERIFRGMAVRESAFSDEDLAVYRRAIARPGAARAALAYYRALFRSVGDTRRTLSETRKISAPTLLLWAEDDVALGLELTDGMEGLVDGPFRLRTFPNCSHWLNEELPEEVTKEILGFLPQP